MKRKHDLESYWQWRLIKVLWLFLMAFIWVCSIVHIWHKVAHTPRHISYQAPVYGRFGQVVGFQTQNRAAPVNEWKYLNAFLMFLVHTGLLVLATIVAYHISLYIVYGTDEKKAIRKEKYEEETLDEDEVIENEEDKNTTNIVVHKETKTIIEKK